MRASITTDRKSSPQARHRNKATSAIVGIATLAGLTASSSAQTELKTYADAKGYINVRTLSCAQLAGTFQEDADFLGVWYSGWLNGHNKKHIINVAATKDGIHETIVYCKSNPDKKVIDAIETVLKGK